MELFSNCQFGIEFGTRISFKDKQKLRSSITENGGTISYIINKKVNEHIIYS